MLRPSHWPSQFKLWLCSRAQPSFAKAYRAKIAKAKRQHGKVKRYYDEVKQARTQALRKEQGR
jgi:hypothetical protein